MLALSENSEEKHRADYQQFVLRGEQKMEYVIKSLTPDFAMVYRDNQKAT